MICGSRHPTSFNKSLSPNEAKVNTNQSINNEQPTYFILKNKKNFIFICFIYHLLDIYLKNDLFL